jgi:hypothetical protein
MHEAPYNSPIPLTDVCSHITLARCRLFGNRVGDSIDMANAMHKLDAVLLAVAVGGWMLVDGVHCLLRGKYIGPDKPGPWSIPFIAIGINPFRLAPLFIVLGVCWLVALVCLLTAPPNLVPAAWIISLMVAVASLWYLPVGTVLSLVYIAVLVIARARFLRSV